MSICTDLVNHSQILKLLFDTMPFVFWKDKTGKYQGGNLNQATTFGFSSPSEFVGKTIYEILNDQQSSKLVDDIDNKIMCDGIPIKLEEKLVTSFGERVYLS